MASSPRDKKQLEHREHSRIRKNAAIRPVVPPRTSKGTL